MAFSSSKSGKDYSDFFRGVTREKFIADADSHGFVLDPHQLELVDRLTISRAAGIYVWGPAGRGKSWIVNSLKSQLPEATTLRMHFHEFFRALHREIYQNSNDIVKALDKMLKRCRVLIFDEFHVHDVGDATFIKRLMLELLKRPIRLVVTSNDAPKELLPNPMFHHMFEPTIELIETTMDVVTMGGDHDYRAHSDHSEGFSRGMWVTPSRDEFLANRGFIPQHDAVYVRGHRIEVKAASEALLWVTFEDFCEAPTAASDYVELARQYSSWALTDIPPFAEFSPSGMQRFANLIDVLHDQGIKTIFGAAQEPTHLGEAEIPPLDPGRLASRLSELQIIDTSATEAR